MLEILSFVLGPVETNAYLIADPASRRAAVIDPAWDGAQIVAAARQHGWQIESVWVTHAHFDHMAGSAAILRQVTPAPALALHPDDLPLWRYQGGAPYFGMRIETGPEPALQLSHGQELHLGTYTFEVRHTPGHTPGHVVFYCPQAKVVFCGDVIFYDSIGRTDLPGGSFQTLIDSIQTQIFSLPDDTRLLSGHGPETTIGRERTDNPFIL